MRDIIEFDKNKVQQFRQSNDLVESVYHATITEKRILATMIAMIKPEHDDFKDYKININKFAEVFEIKGKSVLEQVKKSTKNLLSRTIQINDGDKFLQVNWISSAEYQKGSSDVVIRFDPKLKPYLLNLRGGYTTTLLDQVAKFKSVYAIRFYELFKQYSPRIKVRKFNIIHLKKLLCCEDDYANYANFKDKVINRAISEINNFSDLFITFSELKEGKKVVDIIFSINEKNDVISDQKPRGSISAPQGSSLKNATKEELKEHHEKNAYKSDFEMFWDINEEQGWKDIENRFARLDRFESNFKKRNPDKYFSSSISSKKPVDIKYQNEKKEIYDKIRFILGRENFEAFMLYFSEFEIENGIVKVTDIRALEYKDLLADNNIKIELK